MIESQICKFTIEKRKMIFLLLPALAVYHWRYPDISTWHLTVQPSQDAPMVCLKTVAFDKNGSIDVPYGDGLVQDFHLFPRT